MNTTQYFRYENFLVVQNGDYNDTFDLKKVFLSSFNIIKYLESQNYSELALQRVAILLHGKFNEGDFTFSNIKMYDYQKCIIPNEKIRIEFNHNTVGELEGVFSFYMSNKFILNVSSQDFVFMNDRNGTLTTNEYLRILFRGAGKENRTQLNQIIHSLNTLAKYDAN